MVVLIVIGVVLGPIVVGSAMIVAIGATLGRRARAGRKAGRYTSRPGNSGDTSSSSAFPG